MGKSGGEAELLASCYRRSIELALAQGVRTLAFPNISTGVFGYPLELASGVAIASVRASLRGEERLDEVLFCCFSSADLAIVERGLGDI